MRKYNPYRNLFHYYRGPADAAARIDRQIEDNSTKALINVLEYSEDALLRSFLKRLDVHADQSGLVNFDLQVATGISRPDALIQIGQHNIFIETKIDAVLSEDQIRCHMSADDLDHLICITPRRSDIRIIKNLNSNKLRFVTWRELYLFFRQELERNRDDCTRLLLAQFLDYLEVISMAPFNGWNRKDFEAFLNPEDDPKRELRLRVKDKMSLFLDELRNLAVKESTFSNLKPDVGNIKSNSRHCWGVLCTPPLPEKVHVPHFNFVIGSDEFYMGVQIEGKRPSERMLSHITRNPELFLEILRALNEFHLIIRKRTNPSGQPRAFKSVDVLKVLLQEDISVSDVNFFIKKMNQFDFFEIHALKSFSRGEQVLQGDGFLNETLEMMKRLGRYYNFSLGVNT
jgi:hypothetical protein